MPRILMGLVMLALVTACNPAERTAPTDDRPSLHVVNAAAGSRLAVDGLDMGVIGAPLLLEPGTHLVTVTGPRGGTYTEKVFLSGRGTRRVTLPAGAAP
jgi:hypothetical protein